MVNIKKQKLLCLILVTSVPLFSFAQEQNNQGEQISPKEITLFDLPLLKVTQKSLNKHFSNIGGFKQSRESFGKKHYNKYYSNTQIPHSYYLDFRFNAAGNLTTVTQLYRPYSHYMNHAIDNNSQQLTTKRLARKFVQKLGNPTRVERKGWGGFKPYISYVWEDEAMKITIDRQGEQALGNIFMRYQIKNTPVFMAQNR